MFGEIVYYVFLAIAACSYALVGQRLRPAVLAAFGIAFYAYYGGPAILLLLPLALLSWVLLFLKPATAEQRDRRLGAILVTLATATVLIVFKYSGFIASTVHWRMPATPILPLAISFFTFEFIHIALEVRKGTIDRVPISSYLAFIFFFPTMLAGPIKRWEHFKTGLSERRVDATDVLEGLVRISLGLVKKFVIADNISSFIAEVGLPRTGAKPILLTISVLLYGFRIYFDFAGYSDIAIGSARFFGIRVPENFLFPYRQTNIAAFWRNWHMSLTNWFGDYIYVPLGGSRLGLPRTCLNLLLVMAISGIWHGAAWNFVLWGVWHGLLLVGHRLYQSLIQPRAPAVITTGWTSKALSYGLTMSCVWFGWMLFMWPLDSIGRFFKLM